MNQFIDTHFRQQYANLVLSKILKINTVVRVIDFSSGMLKTQHINSNSDIDLIIVVKRKKCESYGTLKSFLSYLLTRHSGYFAHKFIILPDDLLKEYLFLNRYNIYSLNKIIPYTAKQTQKYVKLIKLYQSYEWLIHLFFSLARSWERKETGYSYKKSINISLKHLEFIYGYIYPKMSKSQINEILLIPTLSPSKQLCGLKSKIEQISDTLAQELGLNQYSWILTVQKCYFGYVLYCPKWVSRLATMSQPLIKKWSFRILPNGIFNYLNYYTDKSNAGYKISNATVNRRASFYRELSYFIYKNKLQSVAQLPIPHYLASNDWKIYSLPSFFHSSPQS
ncbi:hypothetical protein HY947_04175 [Candidatus Gottesmanbacteria bacterium]|nr:hypothetical protein [Candidatus Gottesmanbacteria bacterium]